MKFFTSARLPPEDPQKILGGRGVSTCEVGGYTVTEPGFRGGMSEGWDRDEAPRNLQKPIAFYLEPAEGDFQSSERGATVELYARARFRAPGMDLNDLL